jgi:diguanylate cyclase (GGDEF)-like protein/PAS domain S-box-containing protein
VTARKPHYARRGGRGIRKPPSSAARQRLGAVFDASATAIFICDCEPRYVHANRAYLELMGFDSDAVIGKPRASVMSASIFRGVLASDRRVLAGETVVEQVTLRGAGTNRTVSVLKFPLRDGRGEVYGFCGIIGDSAASKHTSVEMERLASRDALTGLYNRQSLISELDDRLRHGVRLTPSGAVLLLDIDNFKVVNDTFGHAIGDRQLQSVAHVLSERVREMDVVARVGSDEFVIVLAGVTEAEARLVATEIQNVLCEPALGAPIRVSVGMSMFEEPGELTAEALLVSADIALYEAKTAGGGQVAVYRSHASGALAWAQRIRTALTNERLVLYGQPIVDLRTNAVARHELLVRMLSDDGEVIPAAAFVPPAERFGLIGEIDRWVVAHALELAAHGLPVAVNLSAQSLTDLAIVASVGNEVSNGLDPRNVVFEITETAAIANTAEASLLARELAAIGCELALDDFGTGFGSFTYLKHFPARYLKIDADFVRHACQDLTDQAIIGAICGVARALGKETIAEGVEDGETLEVLRQQGVDYAQGFFIGRPKPLPRFEVQTPSIGSSAT